MSTRHRSGVLARDVALLAAAAHGHRPVPGCPGPGAPSSPPWRASAAPAMWPSPSTTDPDPRTTPRFLDAWTNWRVRATFFVLGDGVTRTPDHARNRPPRP